MTRFHGSNQAGIAMISTTQIFRVCRRVRGLGTLALWIWASAVMIPLVDAQSPQEQKPFVVFDGTLYADKPDLAQYGIQPITITYVSQLGSEWFKDATRLPDRDTVQRIAREAHAKSGHVVIDIEHWPLKGDSARVQNSISKYITVLQWFKEAAPGVAVGYYGSPPLRDYWRAINSPASKELQSLTEDNDRLQPLAGAVDILFPSLYTFYTDQGAWVRYAYGQIAQARRSANGKPIYVFLWPQYHDSNRELAGNYLPADYWRLELETVKQYADGIVIWGGWGKNNRPAKWEDDAPWWKVTKEFMKTLKAFPQRRLP